MARGNILVFLIKCFSYKTTPFHIYLYFYWLTRLLFRQIKEKLLAVQKELKVGDVREFDSFMSAVIDAKAFKRISSYIEHAKTSANTSIIAGGKYDDRWDFLVFISGIAPWAVALGLAIIRE